MPAEGGRDVIYKISDRDAWAAAQAAGRFDGTPIDLADGFIHFSTADQVVETAEKHFAGQDNLVLIAVEAARLGDALKWEPSRGGALFPHLYGALEAGDVMVVYDLPLRSDGHHDFPDLATMSMPRRSTNSP